MRIKGFHVGPIHCIDASHASFKYLAGRWNESNTNNYPSVDTDIVAVVQAKLAYLVVMMAGSVPKSAQRE